MPEVECPVCGADIDVSDAEPGDVIECPECGARLEVRKRGRRYYVVEVAEEGEVYGEEEEA